MEKLHCSVNPFIIVVEESVAEDFSINSPNTAFVTALLIASPLHSSTTFFQITFNDLKQATSAGCIRKVDFGYS